jgi:hypothetical protein
MTDIQNQNLAGIFGSAGTTGKGIAASVYQFDWLDLLRAI